VAGKEEARVLWGEELFEGNKRGRTCWLGKFLMDRAHRQFAGFGGKTGGAIHEKKVFLRN